MLVPSRMSGESPSSSVAPGLDVCIESPPAYLKNARFGLLTNQAAVDRSFRPAPELLAELMTGELVALFAPQHGLWSEQQDNMIETPHARHPVLGVPVYSLYSEIRRPTPDMLDGIDFLLVDLQDVGCRVYTFVWTVLSCIEACVDRGVPMVVLDRPNPVGGVQIEGPRLDMEFRSFIGLAPIPLRHDLTLGEAARFLNRHFDLGADIRVVPIRGWRRGMRFQETGLTWLPPSPNLPRIEGVLVYPGQVLIEGTNLSEGRGSTTPFEMCGAPFIDPYRWRDAVAAFDLPGVAFRPVRFEPTFSKWAGQSCGGLFLHVTDCDVFSPVRTTLALLTCARQLWPARFSWRPPPYEYEIEKMPIDILSGGPDIRHAIDGGEIVHMARIDRLCQVDDAEWKQETAAARLYE